MPRATPLLSSFNSGELSPHVEGRVEVSKYGTGCKVLENFIPIIQGPAKRRGSTRFVAEVKDSTAQTWLVRFEFNTANAYQLEFGNQYIRFYTNHGQVLLAGVPYEIAAPWTTADLTNADGTFSLRFTESNDVVYICHKSYAPRKLSRLGATNWTLITLASKKGPFKTANTTTTTVYASAQTGAVTLTASTAIFSAAMVGSLFYLEQLSVLGISQWEPGKVIAAGVRRRSGGINYLSLNAATTGGNKPIHTSGAVYDGDTGVQWQYEDPGYGYGQITVFTDTTHVTLAVVGSLPFYAVLVGNASARWAFGDWSDVDGWPSQVNFYKERLVFGRGQNVWLSVSGDYENFSSRDDSGLVVADMAIRLTLQSDKVNDLQWLSSSDALLCGTAGGEFAVQSITTNLPFGPDNVTAPSVSAFGSRNMIPVRVAEAVLFVQRSGTKLRDMIYDYISNKFNSSDQNVMADHVTQGGLLQIVYQQEPYSLIWCLRADGALIAMTYSREQYSAPPYGGWHRHPIGGNYSGAPAVVESISLIPAPAADRDELWMIVKRTINGVTKRYIEYMEYERRINDDPQDAFYVDCGLTLNNTVAATLTPGSGATVQYTKLVPFVAGSAVFVAGDVGREIHYRYSVLDGDGRTKVWYMSKGIITGYVDSTHVTCTINVAWPSLAVIASGGWRLSFTTVSGLGHLEGQTVQILGDGSNIPEQTVSGGAVTLPTLCSKAHIGLKPRARLQTMRLNAGGADGTSQGKTARINKTAIRFHETLGAKFGPSFTALDEIDFRVVSDQMDGPPGLFTGDQVVDFDGDYSDDPWICVQQDYPMPCTVIGIMPTNSTYDRG